MAAPSDKVEPAPPSLFDAYVAEEADLAARSPVRRQGLDWERSLALARPCVRVITRACGKDYLNLPNPDQTAYRAVCIMQRFCARVPITYLDRCSIAAASLLIACKIEPGMDAWRSLDVVARAAQALRAPAAKGPLSADDPARVAALAEQVGVAERAILLALNFDVRLPAKGPVRWARDVCKAGGAAAAAAAAAKEAEGEGEGDGDGQEAGPLEAAAAAILRDAGYTPAPIMAPPEALAKAALWLAQQLLQGGNKAEVAPAPTPAGPKFAPYARVPQARAEALAAVLERTPAVVRMRAAAAAAGGGSGGRGEGGQKKRQRRQGGEEEGAAGE